MKLGFLVDGIHHPKLLPGLYLLTGFNAYIAQFAVECEIISMLHKNTLIVSGHHQHLFHHPVKDAPNRCSALQGYSYTIVFGQLDIFVNRMKTLPERLHHRSVSRPGQKSPVLGKLRETLTGIQMGEIDAPSGWVCEIA